MTSKLKVDEIVDSTDTGSPTFPFGTTTTNLSYTGTLTGGTGVINIGSGQVVKDANGNVGIGTSSPLARFVVSNGSSENIEFSAGNATFNGGVVQYINRDSGTTRPDMNYFLAVSGGSQKFFTNSAERARIDASGNLLVGTTSSANVAGTGVSIRSGTSGNSSNATLNLAGSDGDFFALRFGSSGISMLDIVSGGAPANIRFRNKANADIIRFLENGNVNVVGALTKGSGSFKIDHPLKPETHHLVHSFVESPQADNIYRGKATLVNGRAELNIDAVAGMTEGTFVALNREVQCFTSNESGWDAVRGSVSGNIITIECQNAESTATISWMVIGERQDQHMYDTDWTDENGKVIVEPVKIDELEIDTLKGN